MSSFLTSWAVYTEEDMPICGCICIKYIKTYTPLYCDFAFFPLHFEGDVRFSGYFLDFFEFEAALQVLNNGLKHLAAVFLQEL